MQEKKNDDKEIDKDKYFLLSLLPTLKSFNHNQKFDAKMEVMNLLHRIRRYGNMATRHEQPNLYFSNPPVMRAPSSYPSTTTSESAYVIFYIRSIRISTAAYEPTYVI